MSVYKGEKLVAGGSIDTHFVRRPAWSQAVVISAADLTAGYKAPADGMIVGACYDSVGGENYYLTLNGTNLMPLLSIANTNIARPLTLSLTVNKGDIVSCTAPSANIIVFPSVKFVPFEDSTVSDVEVVTPELIRNLHDPDWSQAVSITATQLVEGYTVPKRGTIVGSIIPNTYSAIGSPIIKINGIVVSYARGSSNEITHGSVQCPVCANDIVRLEGISKESCDAHISFVPYKAQ